MTSLPLAHHFEDSGVVVWRSSWEADATAFAFKAGPPEGHRVARLLPQIPEWCLSSGHAHPDGGSFIIWAGGRCLTGDTGYAGLPLARHHNTITIGGVGQGHEGDHDVWRRADYAALARARITTASLSATGATIEADLAGLYPAVPGLQALTRTFTFTAPGRVTVQDHVATAAPVPVQWYLHSDTPIEATRSGYLLGAPGGTRLRVSMGSPDGREAVIAPTILMAPGQPGAITKGRQDQRGHHLRFERPAGQTWRFEATLELVPR